MKIKRYVSLVTGGGLALLLLASNLAQAEPDASASLAEAVLVQQKTIVDNQAKIDAKIAEIAEELRLARIFVSRAGGARK